MGAGLSHSALWKSKDAGNYPSDATLELLADLLGTTSDELLDGGATDSPAPHRSKASNIKALGKEIRFIVEHANSTEGDDDAKYEGYAWLIIEAERLRREGRSQDEIYGFFLGATANGIPSVPEVVLSPRRHDHQD
ncbi:MAG: hypothetical protein AAGF20_13695 [Pseudomonadota bacterium]